MNKYRKIANLSQDGKFKDWFEKIYSDHFERLYRYAFTITKQKQLAEDVVSEVFLNVWNKRPDYDEISEISSYLYISVKHLAIRTVSKDPSKFTYSNYDETLQVSDSVDPENLLISSELNDIVGGILAKLSPQSAIIYDFVKNKGCTHKEIALELDISEKTVSNQMNIILNKLRAGISHYLSDSNQYDYVMRISRVISLLFIFNLFA